jgi:hypothetical protein
MTGPVGAAGWDALQRAVTTLREEHRACDRDLLGWPWPVMWDEDVTALHQALTKLGFEVQPRAPQEGG